MIVALESLVLLSSVEMLSLTDLYAVKFWPDKSMSFLSYYWA